jgi:hypothetical protein
MEKDVGGNDPSVQPEFLPFLRRARDQKEGLARVRLNPGHELRRFARHVDTRCDDCEDLLVKLPWKCLQYHNRQAG